MLVQIGICAIQVFFLDVILYLQLNGEYEQREQ